MSKVVHYRASSLVYTDNIWSSFRKTVSVFKFLDEHKIHFPSISIQNIKRCIKNIQSSNPNLFLLSFLSPKFWSIKQSLARTWTSIDNTNMNRNLDIWTWLEMDTQDMDMAGHGHSSHGHEQQKN